MRIARLTDERTLIAVGAGGTVLRIRNAGEDWEARRSGTSQNLMGVTALADGRSVIAVGFGGTVLLSRNAGEDWRRGMAGPIRT